MKKQNLIKIVLTCSILFGYNYAIAKESKKQKQKQATQAQSVKSCDLSSSAIKNTPFYGHTFVTIPATTTTSDKCIELVAVKTKPATVNFATAQSTCKNLNKDVNWQVPTQAAATQNSNPVYNLINFLSNNTPFLFSGASTNSAVVISRSYSQPIITPVTNLKTTTAHVVCMRTL